MQRMEIEIPLPMPTWNRMLGMQSITRKRLRLLLHKFVSLSITHGTDWPTSTDFQGKRCSTELLKLEYLQLIRPSKSRKSVIAKKRAEWKKQLLLSKKSER